MRLRSAAITALSLILLLVWGSGTHVHLWHEHASALDDTGVEHVDADMHFADGLVAETISEGAADHLAGHLHHGHLDLEGAKAPSKAPALKLPGVLILLLVLAPVLLLTALACPARRPVLRPPAWQRWPQLLPPSHAPPLAA